MARHRNPGLVATDRMSTVETSSTAPAHGDAAAVAALIEHTLLRPDATAADIDRLCEQATQFGFASVCVNPYWVNRAAANLRSSAVRICTVIGFPLGASATRIKAAEAEAAIADGASEIDMVMNIGELKGGNYDHVRDDTEAVRRVAHAGGALLKVILETALLSHDEIVTACKLAIDCGPNEKGADFVKTSTGFSTRGASIEDVVLMRASVGTRAKVKASGGIRTLVDFQRMVAAGASRIGTSAGVAIVQAAAVRSAQEQESR